MGAGAGDGGSSIPGPVMTTQSLVDQPGLEFQKEEKEKPPHTELSEAERRRLKGNAGSRASLVTPKSGANVGTNVP